jgi:hypothetical protein
VDSKLSRSGKRIRLCDDILDQLLLQALDRRVWMTHIRYCGQSRALEDLTSAGKDTAAKPCVAKIKHDESLVKLAVSSHTVSLGHVGKDVRQERGRAD